MPRLSGMFRARFQQSVAGIVFMIMALALWALVSANVPAYVIPGPLPVLQQVVAFFVDPALLVHVGASLVHIGLALPLAFILGSALAIMAHYWPVTRLMVHGRVAPFLNAFSGIGWTMLAILWFGLNSVTVVFAIAAMVLPVSIINLQAGLEGLDQELVEMGDSFGRGTLISFLLIVLPSLFPLMFASIRISFGVAWKVALTAELFGGNSGFGFVVNLARQSFDTAQIFAVIAIIVAIAVLGDNFVLAPLQNKLSRQYVDEPVI